MTLRTILLPALKATWKSKWLWFLALLTLTPLTLKNEWLLIVRIFDAIRDPQNYFWFFSRSNTGPIEFSNIMSTAATEPIGALTLLAIGLLLITVIFFISWIIINAQGIIILTRATANRSKAFSLNKALLKIEKLWIPLFELNLGFVIARLLAISLLLLTMTFLSSGLLLIVKIAVFTFIIAALTLLSFVVRIALFKVILELKSIKIALKESLTLIKTRVYECYELSFILYAFSLIVIFIILFLITRLFSNIELGETIIAILLLDPGIVPLIILVSTLLVVAVVIGWLALLQYTTWLTWYTSVTEDNFSHSYIKKLFKTIRSYAKKTTVN